MRGSFAAVRTTTRQQVLAFRVSAQQLDRASGTVADTAVLDVGVQDTGPDGARWALAVRGLVDPAPEELVTAWTVRASPHVYRRADLPLVAAATSPWSDADAAKRIFDAAKPLKEAGIGALAALDTVAAALRTVVTAPTVKGDASGRLATLLPEPYQRDCVPCGVRHVYELPFRLAALRAGLELQPGTSPPVLLPVPGLVAADRVDPRVDVVRGYLRMFGPATPQHVAGYLDAPVREVRARWPADAVEVRLDHEQCWLLAGDEDRLGANPPRVVRLLGPYDLYVQGRDRALLTDDPARAKALWPVLGRPGAVLLDGELAGTWRPRSASRSLTVQLVLWVPSTAVLRAAIDEQAERLAAFRGVRLAGVVLAE